jgi:peroxiredoxin
MRKYTFLALLILLQATISCSRKPNYGVPDVDFNRIKKSMSEWWVYHNQHIILSSNFIALDSQSNRINKDSFLKSLTSGEYIPLKLTSTDSTYYKLFKLDQAYDKTIPEVIKLFAEEAYKNFKLEGKPFPKFDFKDLNGVEYTSENTKGKIVLIKCWFIACPPCIEEFPRLNKLVDKYKNRDDIVFISLAFDKKEALGSFLLKNSFRYAVIPDQKQFEFYDLDVKEYPTHFILDKNGIIRKVVLKADEMIDALEHDVLH